jgi:hypothetical protein
MTDEAVSSWRFDIHKCILKNCEKLVQLICTKLQVIIGQIGGAVAGKEYILLMEYVDFI